MIMNFSTYAKQLKEMSTVVGASKSTEIVGTKFKSLLSISGDIQLGSEFKESLSPEQLTKFSWLKDDDLTIRGGVITLEGLDGKPKAFWLNTAILAQLSQANCLTPEGDILPGVKGISGEFQTSAVVLSKATASTPATAQTVELTAEFITDLSKPKVIELLNNEGIEFNKNLTAGELKQLAIEKLV